MSKPAIPTSCVENHALWDIAATWYNSTQAKLRHCFHQKLSHSGLKIKSGPIETSATPPIRFDRRA